MSGLISLAASLNAALEGNWLRTGTTEDGQSARVPRQGVIGPNLDDPNINFIRVFLATVPSEALDMLEREAIKVSLLGRIVSTKDNIMKKRRDAWTPLKSSM